MPLYDRIMPEQAALIRDSQMFFVASVHPALEVGPLGQGPVNVSPKGGVPLHILDEHHVAFLDYTGSGNETGRHAGAGGPVTVMVMSMSQADAAIVRLYGHATVTSPDALPPASPLLANGVPDAEPRHVITIAVEKTATSCGYGVPLYDYVADRGRDGRGKRYKTPPRQRESV